MIQQTSLKNYKPESKIRTTQNSRILSVLLDFAVADGPVNVEKISILTEIKQSTVHARLNELFKGYNQNGVTYYAVFHSETVNLSGCPCNAYTVTTVCPQVETKEYIERLRKKAIDAIVKYRTARKNEILTLFDKQTPKP